MTSPTDSHKDPARHVSSQFDDGVIHHPHDAGQGYDDLHNEEVAHEHIDVNVRGLITSAIVLVTIAVVTWVAMLLLFRYMESFAAANDPPVSPLARAATQMPKTTNESPYFSTGAEGPALISNEPALLRGERAKEQKQLQGYGWVNQASGVAHIPIDEAKKLVVERGLPVREGATPPAFRVRAEARGESSGGRTVTAEPPEPTAAAPGQAPAQEHGATPQGQPPAPAKPHNPGGH